MGRKLADRFLLLTYVSLGERLGRSEEPGKHRLGILRRKRLRSPNFADLTALRRAILQFIDVWNELAHPFRWTTRPFEKILAKVEDALAAEAAILATVA